MSVFELLLATVLIAALLYVGDRGISFHVAAYSAIASGGKFTGEQAYREMRNPFATRPKLITAAVFLAVLIFLGKDGIRTDWEVVVLFALALVYAFVCWSAAREAFRNTSFRNWKKG